MNLVVKNAIAFVSCSGVACANATFSVIESLAEGGYMHAAAISDDGRVVVGGGGTSEGLRAFRWTPETGTQILDMIPGMATARAYGVSGDGQTIVGTGRRQDASGAGLVWSAAHGASQLAYPGSGYFTEARAASGDGSMIVGFSDSGFGTGERALLWTDGGFEHLIDDPGVRRSFAFDVSSDGAVIIGTLRRTTGREQAFRWTRDSGAQTLIGLHGDTEVTIAASVSNDGEIIGGSVIDASGHRTPVVWSDGGATVTDLSTLPGFEASSVWTVSGDGTVFAGQATIDKGEESVILRAVYWNDSREIFDLNEYLPTLGIDLTGWVLTTAHDMSADGRTLIGEGYFNGVRQAWIATIPSPPAAGLIAIAGIACERRRR